VDREELRVAARRHYRPGISPHQAIILGYAELAGCPLDPAGFDDSAVMLRAERLVLDDVPVGEALATARREAATWGVPS
jgi:hypothetical protein